MANLALKYPGYEVLRPGKLAHLTEVSRFVYETANMNFRPGQPFVGTSALRAQGGDARPRHPQDAASYEHIDPAAVGNERRVLVSELSGKSNIAEKLAEYGLEQDSRTARSGPRPGPGAGERGLPVRGRRGVVRAPGRAARRAAHAWFERLGYPRQRLATAAAGGPVTEATVKLQVGDVVEHTVSEGDGPVNALDGALRKALERHYPRLREMHLVDYKVRVINARAGTAARVRVVIESQDHDTSLGHGRRLRERHRGELARPGRRVRSTSSPRSAPAVSSSPPPAARWYARSCTGFDAPE